MGKNLLHETFSAAELEEIFKRHPRAPLLPVLGSEPWQKAGQNPAILALARPLREMALAESAEPMPILTDELYASFRRTGRRLDFESVYFERRRRLARAAITLLLGGPDDPEAGRLIASLLDKFTSVFEEVSWALAAHVNWHNDDVSGKEPMQIDLFCAETANLMAEMLDLLGAVIPEALQLRVRERLRTHIFENYLYRFDEFHWTKATHNWNAVCHQGVIGAALSQLDNPVTLAGMLLKARGSLPLFLSGFTADGGCTEGIGYWSYGFGWFCVLNEQLEKRTDGELSLFAGDEHIRKIARFGPSMCLSGGKLVNFSDNGAEGGLGPSLLSYLGRRLDEPTCLRESAKGYHRLLETGISLTGERSDLFLLGRLFLRFPEHPAAPEKSAEPDCFLPDLAVLVAHHADARGHVWDFAAKAGHNDEHHNHNDCGGFLLNIDGVRFMAEIGAPEYVKDFFSPKRYEFLAARSLGHPLPMINGFEQAAGREHASRVMKHALGPKAVEFAIDVTRCYPAEAGCARFERTFHFDKQRDQLRIEDVFELTRTESLESALIAIHAIILAKGEARIPAEGLELVIKPGPGTIFDRVEILPYQNRSGQEAFIHRLVLKPETLSARTTLAVEIELA
jgi:hypothetical protein